MRNSLTPFYLLCELVDDAAAHISEEVRRASIAAPVAIFVAVL